MWLELNSSGLLHMLLLENSSVVYPTISWNGEPTCEEGLKLEVGINELLSRGLSTDSKLKIISRPLILHHQTMIMVLALKNQIHKC
jgi:hypothetical protein